MADPLFSIGEFSKITGMSVKTLRFYHEQGLLDPTAIDEQSGYRYYGAEKIEPARIIGFLRGLDFSVNDIAGMLPTSANQSDWVAALERQRTAIEERIRKLRHIQVSLDRLIAEGKERKDIMAATGSELHEKDVPSMLIAAVRMHARYAECGKGFATIGKHFGRHICGPGFLLHYESEYQEEAANFEACFPIRKGAAREGVDVRELAGGRFATLLYQGPYDEMGASYATIFAYVKAKGYTVSLPTREVYHKGPGMTFKGNPRKYLTEIQLPFG